MKLSRRTFSSFLIFTFFLFQYSIQAQSKRLKRPTSSVGISSVDTFVRESFDLYDKVYRFDGYAEAGKPLEDDDLELLIDAVEDSERILATAPDAISDIDGAGVLKQGKATLQMNRAKKALKYSLKTAKDLIAGRSKKENDSDDSEEVTENSSNTPSTNNSDVTNEQERNDLKINSKFDFVPGDKLLFYDDFSNDFVGDFPSKWNTNGSGEVVTVNDSEHKWLKILPGYGSQYIPDVTDLPEEFTLEFDVNSTGIDQKTSSQAYFRIMVADNNSFDNAKNSAFVEYSFCQYIAIGVIVDNRVNGKRTIRNTVKADIRDIVADKHHISIAVNKQRFRMWINQTKYLDVPRLLPENAKMQGIKFNLRGIDVNKETVLLSNFKIAEGGLDLRRQLINEGKFSTNGILFDSGSANIQPQSYGIIRQISQALQQVPDMRLNIIGHTDSDGSDEVNMALSKKRADAVKNALISVYNVSGDRLQTEGKGETEPVGDNKTADGKAQNRRVVFVKI